MKFVSLRNVFPPYHFWLDLENCRNIHWAFCKEGITTRSVFVTPHGYLFYA
ncbi:uncharacterized protein LACBIDRAFT_308883 [Laccaria bicolor S238N-H82]|uniref:Predicted protein n=1 Tax=Laccaria bicolor (strain S238N-H82 / ATCC MYA-4686) TaxID=486041 RepID=B0CUZ8_LACBS|nr:uncharacterized protein LACBIDRAFT_308883 [Laccaria bicolor S238N-H82]EDR13245.1 predicted protein [Laccaria bicolor S238N-H82]|eukprot:XP_001875743.1 predicted protein [Laccaria bicolor S238N-H82]